VEDLTKKGIEFASLDDAAAAVLHIACDTTAHGMLTIVLVTATMMLISKRSSSGCRTACFP
jgi:hypothetical protein